MKRDELCKSAEPFAQRRSLSRSKLHVTAHRQYLQEHQGEVITEQLNAVYESELSDLDPALARAQTRSLPEHEW